jgi:hypothetical protein
MGKEKTLRERERQNWGKKRRIQGEKQMKWD